MKLLIVDDDIYTREGLAETIPWELYDVEEVMQAENGKEALHTVSWYLPDLIISDIRMPQKNGIDFCREAVRLVPNCKIIFITGYTQTEYLKDAIDLSAVLLSKNRFNRKQCWKLWKKQSEKYAHNIKQSSYRKKICLIKKQNCFICYSRDIQQKNSCRKSVEIVDFIAQEMRFI